MKWFTIWANSTSRSCLYDRQDSDITSINHLTEDSQSTSSSLPTIMSPSQRCLAFGYGLSVTSLTPLTMILLHWVSVYHNPHHPSIFFHYCERCILQRTIYVQCSSSTTVSRLGATISTSVTGTSTPTWLMKLPFQWWDMTGTQIFQKKKSQSGQLIVSTNMCIGSEHLVSSDIMTNI